MEKISYKKSDEIFKIIFWFNRKLSFLLTECM